MEPPSLRPRPPWPRHRRRICAFPRPRPPPSPPPTPSPPSASSPPSSALPAHCNRLLTMLAWDGDGDAAIRGLCPLRRLQHLLCHRHLHPWRGMVGPTLLFLRLKCPGQPEEEISQRNKESSKW
ncbi:hypothetical protein ZEAMMB73_Zm00001d043484 [Zea mays]|uniref:Uncharacterized protein n=1 Tax=Zea mays TaxID=4577 RepID=A0A1D6NCJ3_MAIZE|nr:hypothetical protein ZEAMMB73_Zm00001d043484 [Zea mays]ONM38216.1 hypothetical protein ZEAMMB73_Zm00001d043484 [Zea mays]ONM38219.1 hypothetical protein ZEAMMB73_Zm00001d043484 [Zea mays]